MKRYIFIFMGMLLPYFSGAQQQVSELNTAEIKRIADFGKVWGVVNYFHPNAGKGILNMDSLIIKNIKPLIQNPNENNFREVLKSFFSDLGDPQSGIMQNEVVGQSKYNERSTVYTRQLQSKTWYLNVPQKTFQGRNNADSLLNKALAKHQLFVIDLRNSAINYQLGLKQYVDFVQPLVSRLIHNTMILPVTRSFYYKGLIREDFPHDLNILPQDKDGAINDHYQVYFGIRNVSEGAYTQAKPDLKYTGKRFCFIINKYVNVNTFKVLLALRHRNLCNLVVEGELPNYVYGEFYKMKLSDSLSVKIRTAEVLYEDGTLGEKPDALLPLTSDSSLDAPAILAATKLLTGSFVKQTVKKAENTVFIRRAQDDYPSADVPGAELRLLGLFNFWNAIHYFSPNKNLIPQNWDDVLNENIPLFLAAKTEKQYFMALMKLTASIKDGHAILITKKGGRSPMGIMDGNLPIITSLVGNKVYIAAALDDIHQKSQLSSIKEGAELLAIDDVPVKQLAEQWEPYIVASNKAGFDREFYFSWLTNGAVNSKAVLTISGKDGIEKVTLNRIKRDDYYALTGKVNRNPVSPPYCKILAGNIGYLRVNRIYSNELDSLAAMLKNCKTIILDVRGYPKDGSIGSKLAAYIAVKTDTVAYNSFPYITNPDISKNYSLIENEIVKPNTNPDLKNKRYFILADEGNQSQGEGNIITLQGVTKSTTIGRQTAGANGMAITINFPGQYFSFFSGFGEYYSDGTPNQKLGVKIDVRVDKTLNDILTGKDEILEKALELVTNK
ncbi:S41 family peptidase [Pedobacter sp. UBA5917]|uniref:S41 family peptidase n=1 Tax=Pedobacter sp. UBA5917 TaxID=1947061 RepID=UPI0025FD94D7|nr:S41 family peptidase [Pedobacter sp. UBA5917]